MECWRPQRGETSVLQRVTYWMRAGARWSCQFPGAKHDIILRPLVAFSGKAPFSSVWQCQVAQSALAGGGAALVVWHVALNPLLCSSFLFLLRGSLAGTPSNCGDESSEYG